MRNGRSGATRVLAMMTLLAIGVFGFGSAPASAEQMDPNDFDVQVEMGEEMGDPESDCDQNGACTVSLDRSIYDSRSTGTVRALSKNLDGTIRMICDFRHRLSGIYQMGQQGPDWSAMSGSQTMGCAWFMDFENGSTLSGTVEGPMTIELIDAVNDKVEFTGSFTVHVVAGSGTFSGYVGSGTFEEHFVEEWSGGGPQAPAGPAAKAAVKAVFKAPAEEPGMQTTLKRTGGFKVRVVSPRLTKGSASAKLRVVAARGATCSAKAVKGKAAKKIGKAKDRNRDGIIAFPSTVTKKLARGKWKVSVSCVAKVAGKVKKARSTKTLRVA